MAELATIARPYAEAVFKADAETEFTQTQQWLNAVAAVAANEDVQRVAESPKVSREQLLDLLVSGVEGELPARAQNFLRVVLENDRLKVLPKIAEQHHKLVNDQEGVADAVVYSAYAMDQKALADLKTTLQQRFGRKLNLSVQVDESLIGGVRVVVGDEELDVSIKARLEQMRMALVA